MELEQSNREASKTALMFSYYVNRSNKTQARIAEQAGYARQNVVSMFKQGKMKIPIEKIPALAEIIEVDPKLLLRTAMAEYFPKIWEVLQEHFGNGLLVSDEERRILETLRKSAGTRGVKISTERQRQALQDLADSLGSKVTHEDLLAEQPKH